MPAGQPDEPGPSEHDMGEPEEEKCRDPTERPEPRRKDAGMPATKDMRPERRARCQRRLEKGHRGEQARCDDGGEERQVFHLESPILWIIGYRTATAFRRASVTACAMPGAARFPVRRHEVTRKKPRAVWTATR